MVKLAFMSFAIGRTARLQRRGPWWCNNDPFHTFSPRAAVLAFRFVPAGKNLPRNPPGRTVVIYSVPRQLTGSLVWSGSGRTFA